MKKSFKFILVEILESGCVEIKEKMEKNANFGVL